MRKNVLAWSVLVCSVLAFAGAAQAADNWLGTWKLNEAKSKLMPNSFKSTTLTWEATPAGIKLTAVGVDGAGKPMTASYTSKFDGTETPFSGTALADTAAPKRIDANNYENTWKKAGKVTATAKVTVAADGKSITLVQKGTDAAGKAFETTAVYDKQ